MFLDLIAKKLAGSISPDEEQLLSDIIAADPKAAAIYADESALYRSWHFKRPVAGKHKHRDTLKVVAVKSTKHARRLEMMRAAAVLLLIISGICFFHYGPPTFGGNNSMLALPFDNMEDTAIHTVITFRGKEDSVSLSDGSTVRINAASRLRVQFSKDKRKVDFKGEAYFKVAPGRRPFVINTPYATIEVLGTEFNVNTYDSGVTKISLVKGKIRVRAMGKDIIVHAGEELVYTHGSTFQLRACTCNVALAWQHGVCHFFNEDLNAIAPRLERLFDTCVVIDDERLLDKRYTGLIDKSIGLMANINNIPAVTKLDCRFSGDTLHIASK
ncbi:FecR family protein [Chitinophaga sp. GbtcB8]|uniref:FecR family protein n=1 Tax=Chitinophaga sp. GbtcB8 TaxID=2824753 RepID=UPI001C30019B|nr:FecR domain-containing protein [Chitinophaga sp. GbtcB8]